MYQALLPIFLSSQHCSASVQLAGKGGRGMVLGRVWNELRGGSPGAPQGALLRGTGALRLSAPTQVSRGIPHGDKAPQTTPSRWQQRLSLLGHKGFLLNAVPHRTGSRVLPLPALRDLAELSDSLFAGGDSFPAAEPLCLLGLRNCWFQ